MTLAPLRRARQGRRLRVEPFRGFRERPSRLGLISKTTRAAAVRLSTPSFSKMCSMFGDRGFGRSRRWFFLPRPTPRPVSRDESAAHTHLPALTAASPFPRPALEARGLSHHGWRCVMTHDHQFAEGSARGERQADGGARPGPEETGASVETEVFASWSRLAIDAGHTETAPRGPAMKATASSKSVLS